MSAASPAGGLRGMGPWTEHRNAQGRVYWYHQAEKRSVWEKPSELKTAKERAIDSTPWKEYQSGERKYYVHSVTKESSWSLPQELKDLFDQIPDEEQTRSPAGLNGPGNQSPAISAMSPSGATPSASTPSLPRMPMTAPGGGIGGPFSSSSPLGASTASPAGAAGPAAAAMASPLPQATPNPASSLPASLPPRPPAQASSVQMSIAGGEEAFLHLLREKGVDASWTWEQTMRAVITEPLYKSLKTLAERKAAFGKHIATLKEEEEARVRAMAAEVEPKIREEISSAPSRFPHWLTYEGVLARAGPGTSWKALERVGERQAKDLWETIRKELRDKEEKTQRELRHRNMDMLMSLLKTFEADVTTRWKDAKQTVIESEEWTNDAQLRSMDVGDMIDVFDELMKGIERDKTQEMKEKAKQRKRDDRKRRDWFKAKLQSWKAEGLLTRQSIWPDIHARVKGEAEYQEMLGQPGSTPLELFYDVVDELESRFKALVHDVEDALWSIESKDEGKDGKGGWKVREETTWEEFKAKVVEAASPQLIDKPEEELRPVFEELVHVAGQRRRDEQRRAERKLRHLSDDLRYALKKVDHPAFDSEEALDAKTWDEWKEVLADLDLREWHAFEIVEPVMGAQAIDEAKKSAWERFVKRQKEKVEEARAAVAASRKRRSEVAEAGEEESSRGKRRHGEEDGGKSRSTSRRERRTGADLDVERKEEQTSKRSKVESKADESEVEEGEV